MLVSNNTQHSNVSLMNHRLTNKIPVPGIRNLSNCWLGEGPIGSSNNIFYCHCPFSSQTLKLRVYD